MITARSHVVGVPFEGKSSLPRKPMIEIKELPGSSAPSDLVPPRFRFIELAPLSGDSSSKALAINAAGECAGSSYSNESGTRPVRWGQDHFPKPLLTPSAITNAVAHGISSIGEVVGSAVIDAVTHPLRWDRAGSLTFLSESEEANGWAFGISSSGRTVGDTPMTGSPRATIWERDGSHQLLPLPTGAIVSEARGISAGGHVIGDALLSGKTRAIRWLPSGEPIVLTLPPGFRESAAIGISESLDVVGTVRDLQGLDYAAYWRTNGVMTVLGPLQDDVSCTALAVNSYGWIVGRSISALAARSRAFFWTEGTGTLNLTELVERAPSDFQLVSAHDINDSGQIACEGIANGSLRGFLLEPIYHVELARPSARY